MQIDSSRVLIAGATGGFGGELARSFARRGARLVLSGRNEVALGALAGELEAQSITRDLTEPGSADALVTEAADILGGLDVVVNSIGVVAFGPASELDDATLDQLLAVNIVAPVRLARAALGRVAPGGAIVNVSAIVADHPTAGMAAYSASKAALTAFDQAMGREARRAGVRVLDLRPPHMETGLAGRPIAGTPPKLVIGKDPAQMADRVVEALATDAEPSWE